MKKKYIVRLTEQERSFLKDVVKKGRGPAYKIKHANILLNIDADGPNWTDTQAAEAFSCMRNTVSNVRRRFVLEGFEAALERKKREHPPIAPILDGEKEARLIQIACSQPPEGCAKWTLQLLADELVALDVV
ncbi:MAG: Homeodomain-like domain-containing protein, partial [Candidatus Kentron sp. G]